MGISIASAEPEILIFNSRLNYRVINQSYPNAAVPVLDADLIDPNNGLS